MKDMIKTDYGYVAMSINDEIDFDNEGNESVIGQYVMIDLVYVQPEHRGHGHARELVELAKSESKPTGLPVKLAALPKEKCMSQDDLVAFYESCGFTPTDDQGGAAVVMEL